MAFDMTMSCSRATSVNLMFSTFFVRIFESEIRSGFGNIRYTARHKTKNQTKKRLKLCNGWMKKYYVERTNDNEAAQQCSRVDRFRR